VEAVGSCRYGEGYPVKQKIQDMLDAASVQLLNERTRRYIGASGIVKSCLRATWYNFRDASGKEIVPARMLRLFNRGHLEEDRFFSWFTTAGFEVRPFAQRLVILSFGKYLAQEWDEPVLADSKDVTLSAGHRGLAAEQGVVLRQWRFVALGGHYSGGNDGIIRFPAGFPGAPSGWGNLECKTHNTKSFVNLQREGVRKAKPEHWNQMQIYMDELKLQWSLYIAVNKNDDDIHVELVFAEPGVGAKYKALASAMVGLTAPVQRISNDPSWWECKYCHHHAVCHKGAPPVKSCYSCVFAKPDTTVTGAQWRCTKYDRTIPEDFREKGCDEWDPIK
jgi:hypothetical protein